MSPISMNMKEFSCSLIIGESTVQSQKKEGSEPTQHYWWTNPINPLRTGSYMIWFQVESVNIKHKQKKIGSNTLGKYQGNVINGTYRIIKPTVSFIAFRLHK